MTEPIPEADRLYLYCHGCGEKFEGNEPEVAKAHEPDCADPWAGYEILTDAEAFG